MSQIIVRDENITEKLSIANENIIYAGLGHVVLDTEKLHKSQPDILQTIITTYKNNYYFRVSIMVDPVADPTVNYRILNYSFYDYRPKVLKNGIWCHLGIEGYIVKVESQSQSKNFSKVIQYHCNISKIYIDENGSVKQEEIWDKVKFGEIEKFLPAELSNFAPIISFMRTSTFLEKRTMKVCGKSSTEVS